MRIDVTECYESASNIQIFCHLFFGLVGLVVALQALKSHFDLVYSLTQLLCDEVIVAWVWGQKLGRLSNKPEA